MDSQTTVLATYGMGERSPSNTQEASIKSRGKSFDLNDCYLVRDIYRTCVRSHDTNSPICNDAVRKYLSCSMSEK